MYVLSVANQKGGVSKTTTVQALGVLFRERGRGVLCVDLDPQGNLSFAMGADLDEVPTIYNVLKGEVGVRDILQRTGSGDVLPANMLLSGADAEFTATGREYLLKEALGQIAGEYEYVLIDCPPALSILTINAFAAADFVIVPAMADVFSLQGMAQLHDTISSVRKYCNPHLKVAGILLTRFNPRTKLSGHIQQLLDGATKSMDTILFRTYIRSSVSLQESQYQRENMFDYDSRSNAMMDYAEFLKELEVVVNG